MSSPLNLAFERVLGRSIQTLRLDDGPDTLEDWDSHAHLELLSQLEENFGIQFSLEEQLELSTVGRILDALRSRGLQVQDPT